MPIASARLIRYSLPLIISVVYATPIQFDPKIAKEDTVKGRTSAGEYRQSLDYAAFDDSLWTVTMDPWGPKLLDKPSDDLQKILNAQFNGKNWSFDFKSRGLSDDSLKITTYYADHGHNQNGVCETCVSGQIFVEDTPGETD